MIGEMAKICADVLGSAGELTLNRMTGPALHRIAPSVNRPRPVIAIPGFMAAESSLQHLIGFLNQQGFTARGWGLGRNRSLKGTDWRRNLDRIRRHLADQIRKLADQHSAPVALIGHSLGGIYARELAQQLESDVDRVITLGSPTIHPYRRDRNNQVIHALGRWVNRQNSTEFGGRAGLLHWDAAHPALPCVAIHSPIDGFVHESGCHIPGYIVAQAGAKAPRENVRVLATHLGMTHSVWVLLAVADRLAADRRHWQPFDPQRYFPGYLAPLRKVVYPDAQSLWRDGGAAAFIRRFQ